MFEVVIAAFKSQKQTMPDYQQNELQIPQIVNNGLLQALTVLPVQNNNSNLNSSEK
ncbi:hypothetical protein [Photobacterium leiognathi]|uniref:hypothetical protein n=1 Tax=Photobacterium leiognathi TaxID=553611 RepID=UPI0029821D9A|nr:hypothetical protein [Photobacterium leiognathi]